MAEFGSFVTRAGAAALFRHPPRGMLYIMVKDFRQIVWDERLRQDWREILRLAIDEDMGSDGDLTSRALVADEAVGRAVVVARRPGIVAGLPGVEMTLRAIDLGLGWSPHTEDGRRVEKGDAIGTVEDPPTDCWRPSGSC